MSLLASKHPSVEVLVSGCHDPFSYDKWQSVYRGVYNICTNPGTPQAETLFQHLRDVLSAEHGEAEFLGQYCSHFNMFSTGTSYVSELFCYLNRYWIRYAHSEYGQAPIQGVYPIPEDRVIASILHLFQRDRESDGDQFEHGDLIASTVQVDDFHHVHINRMVFPLAQDLLERVSIADYLVLVETLCRHEERRCDGKMHRITVQQTRQTCCRVLVEAHTERLCDHAEAFFESNQTQHLRRLFGLFSELPTPHALVMLKNIFKTFVERSGMAVVKQFEHHDTMRHPEEYIEALVAVRDQFYDVAKRAFGLDPLMRTALDQACRLFTNSHPSLPELLAKYTHVLMTQSAKYASDECIEKRVEYVGVVFCLLDDKDVFKAMYSKLLSKRLIQGGAMSMDVELSLIQKLRDICGCEFVSKLQKMFSDKIISTNAHLAYTTWKEERDQLGSSTVECWFDVLTAGVWPIPTPTQDIELKLSAVCQQQMHLYATFYGTQSTGRRLHWVHHMSHGVLRMVLTSRSFEVHANYHQLVMLLLYNTRDSCSVHELETLTGFSKTDIQYHMQPLVKVLPKYTQLSAPKAKAAATSHELSDDRKMTMQAAIVRIMKARRESSFANLLSESAQMLAMQFVPTPAFLQQNLDILVDKEYIRLAPQQLEHADSATPPAASRSHAAVYIYVA
ncbi:hypothetical protein DYB30_007298 [Aphanomyces astaci]|uniref:Cullin family profile domain-containing protein n=2 Tax=Aphanomyces astaci TaxID=112090 RepID=A0A397CQ77_APHAT|nr:hypothetical protein DYB38_001927 [Aphanomyces astaci]RHY71098.1 hypothetical protein DYB30_007298 [Aphanomyces astaci]